MSKVLTFSRTFPAYHPKAGQPTNFISKIWKSFHSLGIGEAEKYANELAPQLTDDSFDFLVDCPFEPKHHTIRAGHRWKAGDKFSPRVWSGKPYQSKQIIIAPDIEIKKVWKFEIKIVDVDGGFASKGFINGVRVSPDNLMEVAGNDGLELADFLSWFQFTKSFEGQIICWNENVNY